MAYRFESSCNEPWAVITPRRAHTTNYTIHDGNFIADNRREETIHHDNSQVVNNSDNSTVFHGPVQGYVHSAKNRGDVNGFVKITNVSHPAGASGDASPMNGIASGKHFLFRVDNSFHDDCIVNQLDLATLIETIERPLRVRSMMLRSLVASDQTMRQVGHCSCNYFGSPSSLDS
jgi:hypothetical protein